MRNFTALFLFFLIATMLGCATFKALPPETQSSIIAEGLRIVLKPECVRLAEVGPQYVSLCEEVIETAIVAIGAGITKDASLICPVVTARVKECSLLPDDSRFKQQNIATCERVIRAAGLACTLFLTKRDGGGQPPIDTTPGS